MINGFDRTYNRRILKFLAVHPYREISPVTLLVSLINLSRKILSYKSKVFVVHRKNAHQIIRHVTNLLIFFDEIQIRGSILSRSIILSFSELHFTFQKIQFLLQDCTRQGAKFTILMKSEFVTSQFRALTRAMATALDVLPMSSIDVDVEVKELVDLVARQTRRAKVEVDLDDQIAINSVRSVFDQLEKGIGLGLSEVKGVLDRLEIRTWHECDQEIRFLDHEIELSCDDHKEVKILSSLMGFLSYCRVIVFDTLDCQRTNQPDTNSENEANLEWIRCLNPDDFRCPISLGLMSDPVAVSTGHTYDRSSIEQWLKTGNTTCPNTGEMLTNLDLVPNITLLSLIQQFFASNGVSFPRTETQLRDISKTIFAGSAVAERAIRLLAVFLLEKLVFGTDQQQNKAALEIRLLTKTSIFNRSCLIENGTIPPLINLLSSWDSSTQENSIAALLNLSKHVQGKKQIIQNGGLNPIVEILKNGLKMESKQIAAATLFYLASIEDHRKLIGENPETIPSLLRLIKEGSSLAKKNSLVTIFALLLHPENHQKVLKFSTVPLLIDLLSSPPLNKTDIVIDTLSVLAALSQKIEGTLAILQTNNALSLIMSILNSPLFSSSKLATEYAVSILLSSCIHGGYEVVVELTKDSLLPASLYRILTDGTDHGSKKARSLLRIVHRFCETSSSESAHV